MKFGAESYHFHLKNVYEIVVCQNGDHFGQGRWVKATCIKQKQNTTWWRHQMETFSALQVICAGNSPVTGEFPAQRPVTRSFDVFFDLRLNKRLSKQSWGWWFETPSWSLWRHCNDTVQTWCIILGMYCTLCRCISSGAALAPISIYMYRR